MRTTTVLLAVALCHVHSSAASQAAPARDPIEVIGQLGQFTDAAIGYGAQTPEGVHAFRAILERSDADAVFKRLLGEASLPGQLVALCGLYFTDRVAFAEGVRTYETMRGTVPTQFGCLRGEEPVARLVRRPGPCVVRKGAEEPPTSAPSHDEDCDGVMLDIAGGGYPHLLRGTLWPKTACGAN